MELSEFKIEQSVEIALVENINSELFDDITSKITKVMESLGINLEGKSIYYQRNADKTSILAIKVTDGKDEDYENYMFNGCDANYYRPGMSCDVYLHANAKSGQVSMAIANMISQDIVDFFDTLEGELAINGLRESECSIRIPLVPTVKKEETKKETKGLRFIRKIFKRDRL